jgi:hypothetical protein
MLIRPLTLAALLAVALLAPPALASAQYDPSAPPRPGGGVVRGPGPQGITFSARLGYGIPSGPISDEGDGALDDLVDWKVPLWVEVGFRFNPQVWGGLYLELASTSVNDAFCLPGRSCDASDIRFGLDLQLHLRPYRPIDPWIGIGFGVEVLRAEAFDLGANDISEFSYAGLELPLLEGGVDVALSPYVSMGPYVSWSLGTFTSFRVETPGLSDIDGRIDDRALHSWFEVGVKGTLKL